MQHTLDRLRREFLEMPGLRLTAAQVQRLCGGEPTLCQAVLDALVDARFLCVMPDGTYTRTIDIEGGLLRPARAALSGDRRPARAS